MAKRKLTPEILELIELYASDEYTLDEIREEADIVKPLMEDPQVLESIEKGRIKWFIEIIATDGDIDVFLFHADKTLNEAGKMMEDHEKTIELRKNEIKTENQKIKKEKREYSGLMLSPSAVGGHNICCQVGEERAEKMGISALQDGLSSTVEKLKGGDSTALLEILMSNITQLHLFNGLVAQNLVGDLGKQLNNFEKLFSMQVKLMNEERKSILAINEIVNPKRTTFIKEANQHNHLHQNSEKKDENENELQKLEQAKEAVKFTEAEVVSTKEKTK